MKVTRQQILAGQTTAGPLAILLARVIESIVQRNARRTAKLARRAHIVRNANPQP